MRLRIFYGLAALTLALGGLLLGGCSKKDHNGGGGGSSSGIVVHSIPGFGTFYWHSDGGSAAGQAGRNGGNAGDISMDSAGGVGPDDGRTRPTPASNLLTSTELGDNLVTYTELETAFTPSVSTGTATFDLGGMGFMLPAGATLDLSDATSGTVDEVIIISDDVIRLRGAIVTARTGAASVSVVFVSNLIGGPTVVFDGSADTSGNPTFDGGNFELDASNGTLIALGSVTTAGGAASSSTDAGNGGTITYNAGLDLLIPYGSFSANGGSGGQNGGPGGNVDLSAGHSLTERDYWGASTNGGNGDTGDGADAGDYYSQLGGYAVAAVRYSGIGGSTNGGGASGGRGGYCYVEVAESTGIVYGEANSGSVLAGGPTFSGWIRYGGYYGTSVEVRGTCLGGTGPDGGDGGVIELHFTTCRGGLVAGDVSGGDGVASGGDGGLLTLVGFQETDVDVQLARIEGQANGGSASGSAATGGNGGTVVLGEDPYGFGIDPYSFYPGLSVSASAVEIDGQADGGAAPAGAAGHGGWLGSTGGYADIAGLYVSGTANGGASSSGTAGDGGYLGADQGDGTVEIFINADAHGGTATGTADGGAGGELRVIGSEFDNYGSARVTADVDIRGSDAVSGDGGEGGLFDVYTTGGGPFSLVDSQIDARGGNSQTGNGGDAFIYGFPAIDLDGPASLVGGYIDMSGGNGSTVSGDGSGGDGVEDISLSNTGYPVTVDMAITCNGGSGSGTGDGGLGGIVTFDLNGGSLTVRGTIACNGGSATGTGDGGLGGSLQAIGDEDLVFTATANCNGGDSAGGAGGDVQFNGAEALSTLDFGGTWNVNGGNGVTGGDAAIIGGGDTLNLGNDAASVLIIEASAVVRCNGGDGTTGGAGGQIGLDPAGTGGATNTALREEPGSFLQVIGGTTGGAAGSIRRD